MPGMLSDDAPASNDETYRPLTDVELKEAHGALRKRFEDAVKSAKNFEVTDKVVQALRGLLTIEHELKAREEERAGVKLKPKLTAGP